MNKTQTTTDRIQDALESYSILYAGLDKKARWKKISELVFPSSGALTTISVTLDGTVYPAGTLIDTILNQIDSIATGAVGADISAKLRAWAKTGDLQSTNGEDVAVTDDVYQQGKVHIGADETQTPFRPNYTLQVGDDSVNTASARVWGYTTRYESFRMIMGNNYTTTPIVVYIDHINGLDPSNVINGREPHTYIGSTSTVGNRFQTFNAFSAWANRLENQAIILRVQNTTAIDPLILNFTFSFMNKMEIDITGDGSTAYLQINQQLNFYNVKYCGFSGLNVDFGASGSIYTYNDSEAYISDCVFNYNSASGSCFHASNGAYHFLQNTTINFAANNQHLFHTSGNYGGKIILSIHSINFTLNTGIFTGIYWSNPSYTTQLYIPTTIDSGAFSFPNVDMSGTIIQFGNSKAIKYSNFDYSIEDYALSLGTTNPLRFSDLNSGSSNMTFTTKKKLIIDESGKVGVYDDTGGGGSLTLQCKASSTITTGTKQGSITTIKTGNWTKWTLTTDEPSSTAVVNIKKNGTDIFTTNKPTLTAQKNASGTDMSGTTTAYAVGDYFEIVIESNDNSKGLTITLE